jgi:squalene-hopene/tetraprenyl-beta-curcumene cyclase
MISHHQSFASISIQVTSFLIKRTAEQRAFEWKARSAVEEWEMNRHLLSVIVTPTFVLLATLQAGTAKAEDSPQPSWSPQAAAKYLDGRADWWLTWSGSARGQGTACLSCHTTVPYALARPVLGAQLGETAAGAVEKKLIGILDKRVQNWDKIVTAAADKDPFVPFYSGQRKPSALGTESVLNALILVNHDVRRGKGVLRPQTGKALTHLWEQQQDNGAWIWLHFGLNPWENDGAYYGASLAALAIGMAGKDHFDQPGRQAKVSALKKYLRTQSPHQALHHRLVALWASSRLPGMFTVEDRKKLIEEIHKVQEADGGWSVPKLGKKGTDKGNWKSNGVYPSGVSDGYATGLVVLALKSARVAADDAKLQQGIAWLRARQQDGTWPACYPNRSRDPQTDVGKFMRDAATAFAVLALSEPDAGAGK